MLVVFSVRMWWQPLIKLLCSFVVIQGFGLERPWGVSVYTYLYVCVLSNGFRGDLKMSKSVSGKHSQAHAMLYW